MSYMMYTRTAKNDVCFNGGLCIENRSVQQERPVITYYVKQKLRDVLKQRHEGRNQSTYPGQETAIICPNLLDVAATYKRPREEPESNDNDVEFLCEIPNPKRRRETNLPCSRYSERSPSTDDDLFDGFGEIDLDFKLPNINLGETLPVLNVEDLDIDDMSTSDSTSTGTNYEEVTETPNNPLPEGWSCDHDLSECYNDDFLLLDYSSIYSS